MKTLNKIIPALAVCLILFTACNKTKKTSNWLMNAGTWTVTELSVDGVSEDELPTWIINDCDIYDANCEGHWTNEEGGESDFIWQFRDKGETFEVSYQDEHAGHSHENDHATEEAIAQCHNFSGIYSVTTSEKEKMTFTSTVTEGFMGQTATITIEKQ